MPFAEDATTITDDLRREGTRGPRKNRKFSNSYLQYHFI